MGRKIKSQEASRILGVHKGTLHRWESDGRIKVERNPLTGYRIYDEDEVRSWVSKLKKHDYAWFVKTENS